MVLQDESSRFSTSNDFFFNGNQYLIVNASGGRFYGYENDISDYIYAFKLKKN